MPLATDRPIVSFRDLTVWQESISLVKDIYALCSTFPKEELYGLTSQMKRAAVSVASNIAEGHARRHRAEYRQSVYVAIGSLAELETQLIIAQELRFTDPQEVTPISERMTGIRKMLITLGNKLS